MTNLYMRYRNATTDPWIEVPSLAGTFPGSLAGSLPLLTATIGSGTHYETPCGCPESAIDDTYLVAHAVCPPMPAALQDTVMLFLLLFKVAAFHEIRMQHFGAGHYVTSDLSLVNCAQNIGMIDLSFRLASTIANALV